jgi:hypothetical protein
VVAAVADGGRRVKPALSEAKSRRLRHLRQGRVCWQARDLRIPGALPRLRSSRRVWHVAPGEVIVPRGTRRAHVTAARTGRRGLLAASSTLA